MRGRILNLETENSQQSVGRDSASNNIGFQLYPDGNDYQPSVSAAPRN